MKRIVFMSFVMLALICDAYANDGVFYVNGNELTPITSTDISVKKEILSLKKLNDSLVAVSVYYEFYNPGDVKHIDVGFEADPPQSEVETECDDTIGKKYTNIEIPHPYIKDFTVSMNGNILPYRNIKEWEKKTSDGGSYMNSKYVYLFNGDFKTGVNVVQHTYICKLGINIASYYQFYYVLDAAKRWAGGEIGDFTLFIDMGDYASYCIPESFFRGISNWSVVGNGKMVERKSSYSSEEDNKDGRMLKMYIRRGVSVFHQNNFVPDKNLSLSCCDGCVTTNYLENKFDAFKYKDSTISEFEPHIPFTDCKFEAKPKNDFSARVIRNIPYARKGYVFKNKELRDFFTENVEWYIPDPNYKYDNGNPKK